ncbi:hypothetical protein F4823DRAFT_640930 [Ustulina deusta]|nr:hypothetical protein F4823DRAFT_640930 [Ustulina deusta]
MKINGLTVFSTLALFASLSVAAIDQGDASNVAVQIQGDSIGNNSAVADGADAVNQNEDQGNNNEDEDNAGQNGSINLGQFINGTLGDGLDINIDPNDIQGSLGQNILNLLLSMGICNFNLNSLGGLSLGNEIQLLLQLQQLQQLQVLGIVNSFTVDQIIQREILSQSFNLNIIKRSISASVKRASRGKKRTTVLRRQCANAGQ